MCEFLKIKSCAESTFNAQIKNGTKSLRLDSVFFTNGGGNATLRQTFLTAIFYAQTIEKFVAVIPDMIESQRIAKKVSGKQKSLKSNVEDLPLSIF